MNNTVGFIVCLAYIFGIIGLAEGLRRWRSYGSEFELGSDSEIRIEDCPQCCGAIELQFQPEDEHGHYRLDVNRAY